MPFYHFFYEVDENSRLDTKEWIDGDYIERVQIKLPSGQRGTLRIQLYYGEKQIIPFAMGQWIAGDNDDILITDLIPIEGKRYPLRIIADNTSVCYPRSFWLRVQTKFEEETLWYRVGESVYNAITKAFLGMPLKKGGEVGEGGKRKRKAKS
ncbi:MAG: hypothetical protein QXO75_00670 [Nitrososphaerota archaeon]